MRTGWRASSRLALLGAAGAGLVATAALPACSLFRASDPEVLVSSTFRGPTLGLDATDRVHVVTARVPNPGWRLEFDRADEAPGPTRVLMTLRRPNPTLIYTRQEADLSTATSVVTDTPIEVFARIVEHDARRSSVSYERVLLDAGPE